ncbi:MAG: hypothetical protein ABIE23_05495 [archaeon]
MKEKIRKAISWIGHRFEAIMGALILIAFMAMFSSLFGTIFGWIGYTLPVGIPAGIIVFVKWIYDFSWEKIFSAIPRMLNSEWAAKQDARLSADGARDPTMASQQGRDYLTQTIIQGEKSRKDLIEEEILTPLLNDVEEHIGCFSKGIVTIVSKHTFNTVREKKNLYLKTRERPKIEAYYSLVEENNERYLAFIKKSKTVFKSIMYSLLDEVDSQITLGMYATAIEPAIDRLCNNWSYELIQALELNSNEAKEKVVKRLDEGLPGKLRLAKISEKQLLEKRKEIATNALGALAKEKETKQLLEKRKQVLKKAEELKSFLEKILEKSY